MGNCVYINCMFIKPHPPSSTLLLLCFFALTCNPSSKHSLSRVALPWKFKQLFDSNNNFNFAISPLFRINHWKIFLFRAELPAEEPPDGIKMLFFFNTKRIPGASLCCCLFGYGILIYFQVIFYLPSTHPWKRAKGEPEKQRNRLN